MKTITLFDKQYTIFFRYLSKFGKQPHFRKHAPFQAITICTIQSDGGKFTAQDVAVCSLSVAPKPTPAQRAVLRQLKEMAQLLDRLRIEAHPDTREIIRRAEAEQHPDQYSRREGRLRSLAKTLDRCSRLRKIKDEFIEAYLALDPQPVHVEPVRISEERKEELAASGQEGKVERRLQRKAARLRASRRGA